MQPQHYENYLILKLMKICSCLSLRHHATIINPLQISNLILVLQSLFYLSQPSNNSFISVIHSFLKSNAILIISIMILSHGILVLVAFISVIKSELNNDCGTTPSLNGPPNLQSGRILGGKETVEGEFPWQVLLEIVSSPGKSSVSFCGATLLSTHWVITAAHCVASIYTNKNHRIVLRIGPFNPYVSNMYSSEIVFIHPEYNSTTFENDIALLVVNTDVELSSEVQPICLSKDINLDYQWVTLTGWGRLSNDGAIPEKLMKVEVPVVPIELCKKWYQNAISSEIVDTFLCTGTEEGGKDACQGDAGGPVQIKKNGKWFLVGIISSGYGCGKPKIPGVSIDVRKYIQWIEEITRDGAAATRLQN